MSKSVVVIKLGGSAITDKSKFETLKTEALNITAKQIKEVHESGEVALILVHGAGSFGHFQAKEFSLSSGGRAADWREGLIKTRNSVLKLNSHVVEALRAHNILAVTISPFPSVVLKHKELADAGVLKQLIGIAYDGFIPVCHGDVVLDDDIRCSIFSGDRVILWVCCSRVDGLSLGPSVAVFLADVPGVYTHSPSHPDAVLISEMTVKKNGEINLPDMEEAAHPDVTGGMRGKLQEAALIAASGVVVYVVEVGTPHAKQAMRGVRPDVGTAIRLEK